MKFEFVLGSRVRRHYSKLAAAWVAITLVLGLWGIYLGRDTLDIKYPFDYIFWILKFFALDGAFDQLDSFQIHLGRFFAIMLVSAALLFALFKVIRNQIAYRYLKRNPANLIVYGTGQAGQAVLKQLAERKPHRALVIETPAQQSGFKSQVDQHPMRLCATDVCTDSVVPLLADDAHVYVSGHKDITNLWISEALAHALNKRGNQWEIWCDIQSHALLNELRAQSNRPSGINLFSIHEARAYGLIQKFQPWQWAIQQKQQRVRMVFIGNSPLLLALAQSLIELGWHPQLKAPSVHFWITADCETREAIETLKSRMQGFVEVTCESLNASQVEPLASDTMELDAVTAYIIDHQNNDEKDLTRALNLATQWPQKSKPQAAPILVGLDSPDLPSVAQPVEPQSDSDNPIMGFCSVDQSLTETLTDDDYLVSFARFLDYQYRKNYITKDLTLEQHQVIWRGLSENMKQANLACARHMPVKLHNLGLKLSQSAQSNPAVFSMADLDQHTQLALKQTEHDRWMADRLLRGWRYGPERNDAAKIHPDLVPWEQLSQHSQDKDDAQLESLFNWLQSPLNKRYSLTKL